MFLSQLDHFRHSVGEKDEDRSNTFQQRYFVCSEFWGPENPENSGAAGEEGLASKGDAKDGGSVGKGKAGRGGGNAPEGATGPIFFYVSPPSLFRVRGNARPKASIHTIPAVSIFETKIITTVSFILWLWSLLNYLSTRPSLCRRGTKPTCLSTLEPRG